MIDVWIKSGYGKGEEVIHVVSTIPRKEEEIWVNFKGINRCLTVCRVVHQIDQNRVLIFTPEYL